MNPQVRVLRTKRLVTPAGVIAADLVIGSGRFVDVADYGTVPSGEVWTTGDASVRPALVDTHTHGGWGIDFNTASEAEFAQAHECHAAVGVTRLLLTLVPEPVSRMIDTIHRAVEACRAHAGYCGLHLEGPFLSTRRLGALPAEGVRPYDAAVLAAILHAAAGYLRVMTVAPEALPNTAITKLRQAGVALSIGHTCADATCTRAAIEAGVHRATHLCNAMPPLHHRSPGPLLPLLCDHRVRAEIIVDGEHVADDMIAFVRQLKGRERLLAVSDAISLAGQGARQVEFAGETVRSDGRRALRDDGTLAGSVCVLPVALRRAAGSLDLDEVDTGYLGSWAASIDLGLPEGFGFRPGAVADLLVYRGDELRAVLRDGVRVDEPDATSWLPPPCERVA